MANTKVFRGVSILFISNEIVGFFFRSLACY